MVLETELGGWKVNSFVRRNMQGQMDCVVGVCKVSMRLLDIWCLKKLKMIGFWSVETSREDDMKSYLVYN